MNQGNWLGVARLGALPASAVGLPMTMAAADSPAHLAHGRVSEPGGRPVLLFRTQPIGRVGDRAHVAPRGTFRQIAGQLRELIRDGSLAPGEMVPSEQTLVEEHGVARGTVRSALALLVDAGLIEVVPGQGRRVVGHPAGENPSTAYQRIASDLARRVRSAEFGADGPLPSEAALTAEYGVSRSTVRRAYRMLVDEGLVVVRHGVGAFTAPS